MVNPVPAVSRYAILDADHDNSISPFIFVDSLKMNVSFFGHTENILFLMLW